MFKKTERKIFVCHSDTHGGHWLGLLNPNTVLTKLNDEGETEYWSPELSATQEWLWECFEWGKDQVSDLAGKDEIIVSHVGDITQGPRFGKLVPDITNGDQLTIAVWNIKPLSSLKNVKRIILATGTEVHVPDSTEAKVAAAITHDTKKRVQTFHQARLNAGKEWFDIAHHGAHPGTRDWLRGNVATYYLRSRVYEDRRCGKEPSVLYVRGHYHVDVHVTLNDRWEGLKVKRDLVVIPSFSGPTRHSIKATQSTPVLTVGFFAIEVIDGRLCEIYEFFKDKDLRIESTL